MRISNLYGDRHIEKTDELAKVSGSCTVLHLQSLCRGVILLKNEKIIMLKNNVSLRFCNLVCAIMSIEVVL